MMKLDQMSMDELEHVGDVVAGLVQVGRILEGNGGEPTFNLTPGQSITIDTGLRMPMTGPLPPLFAAPFGCSPFPPLSTLSEKPEPALTEAAPRPNEGADEPTGPVDPIPDAAPPPVVVGDGPEQPTVSEISAEAVPNPSGTARESGGDQPAPAPAEIAAGGGDAALPPGGDDTPANHRMPWSAEEDAQAVDMAVRGISPKLIATALGRPLEGTRYGLYHVLRDVIAEAKNAPLTATDVPPKPEPKKSVVSAEPPAPRPLKAVQNELKDGLYAHLKGLPRKQGWTLALDAELMRLICVGRRFPEIEADLGLSKVKERFELLTDSRSYAREHVKSALDTMLAALPKPPVKG